MSLESTNLSRRKLLKASAIGVPAAGMLAFGSTLVTATSANAISADGWWGEETSAGLQRFMNAVVSASLTVDGVISSQPSRMAPSCPGIVGGWEWVDGAAGSPTIQAMNAWLKHLPYNSPLWRDGTGPQGATLFGTITTPGIKNLQEHYGITQDGRLDGPSQTIMALQNEINQYVG
ncbi:chemotaxis protein CheA [Rothia sp. HMSC067H10]|uniref:chemotaxis protein CheA n=1 Tax=Rothia sp. HMSC067H10 TaxID=1739260 RepID=UPI0008A12460|nr:chemotaxis protein CheA [Rothia sp. HMSC067H10]OFR96346.1 chemotaxis protein CheA [Rothia sp. HMSC067H10]